MAEMRRLRGHAATVTSCVAFHNCPHVFATSGEDGRICLFDTRCRDLVSSIEVAKTPVTSLCLNPGGEDTIFASSGTEIKCFDVHLGSSSKALKNVYNHNEEEINQIVCNSKSSFLASADDSGEVKVIDLRDGRLYKALKSGHSSICSSVQFVPWKPWQGQQPPQRLTLFLWAVITGGLDSKVISWDFRSRRHHTLMDYGLHNTPAHSGGGCVNPAFVHALAVPDAHTADTLGRVCAVGRGDGAVHFIDLPTSKPSGRLLLDFSAAGHTASVSSVGFAVLGSGEEVLVSGGDDRCVKVWNVGSRPVHADAPLLRHHISLKRKVNWVSVVQPHHLIVCDTSRVVKLFTLR